jgi:hypothetical protein
VQFEDREQCRVDPPLLFDCDPPDLVTETFYRDRSELLDEQAGAPAADVELRTKRRRPVARRRWSDEHNGTREHGVALHDHGEPAAVLFVPDALGQSKLVDVTASHAARSSLEPFHELGDGGHLRSILVIVLQGGDFGHERLSIVQPRCSGDQRGADNGRSTQPGALEQGQCSERLVIKSHRDCGGHAVAVGVVVTWG